ncbi:MAG: hypothetical protein Q8P59_10325, partial [Dehalococcoidia bacterium]|nr:hypothetical protein [Dehalococcoidia bacterium]
ILADLENGQASPQAKQGQRVQAPSAMQLSLFAEKPLLLQELAALEIDSLSPLEAITKLYELKKRASQE